MENYTGFEKYKAGMTMSDLDTIRRSNSPFLKIFKLFLYILLIFLFEI